MIVLRNVEFRTHSEWLINFSTGLFMQRASCFSFSDTNHCLTRAQRELCKTQDALLRKEPASAQQQHFPRLTRFRSLALIINLSHKHTLTHSHTHIQSRNNPIKQLHQSNSHESGAQVRAGVKTIDGPSNMSNKLHSVRERRNN